LAPEIGTISFIFGKPIPLFTGQNIAKRSPRIFSSTSISTPVNKPKLAMEAVLARAAAEAGLCERGAACTDGQEQAEREALQVELVFTCN